MEWRITFTKTKKTIIALLILAVIIAGAMAIRNRRGAETEEKLTPPPTTVPTATTVPAVEPTVTPTEEPTKAPEPTLAPTSTPTAAPTSIPTLAPTSTPTAAPTSIPTAAPTSIPTKTPTPTAAPTATPTLTPTLFPASTPTPAPTATPTLTPTLFPASTPTPAPTNTPTPIPTAIPVMGKIRLDDDNTSYTLTKAEAAEIQIFLSGNLSNPSLEYGISDASVIHGELVEGIKSFQYTLRLNPVCQTGRTNVVLALYDTDEYGNKVFRDEVILSVKVAMPAYDPAADGYPILVEAWSYENFSMEVWKTDKVNYRSCVLIINGEGTVTRDIILGWSTYLNYSRSIKKIYFSDGITEIESGLPVEEADAVRFPSTLKVIGKHAFSNADLKEAVLPEGLETIEAGAFSHNYYLEKISIPSTVKYIGRGAFVTKCQSPVNYTNTLKEIYIPKSVEFFGYGAFWFRYDLVITLEKGTDTTGFEEGWNENGDIDLLTTITE